MKKVTSHKEIEFPGLNWGIKPGEMKELPEDKQAQEIILDHPAVAQIDEPKSSPKSEDKKEEAEPNVDTAPEQEASEEDEL